MAAWQFLWKIHSKTILITTNQIRSDPFGSVQSLVYNHTMTVSTSRCWCFSPWWFLTCYLFLTLYRVQNRGGKKMCSKVTIFFVIYSELDSSDPWTGADFQCGMTMRAVCRRGLSSVSQQGWISSLATNKWCESHFDLGFKSKLSTKPLTSKLDYPGLSRILHGRLMGYERLILCYFEIEWPCQSIDSPVIAY